MNLLTRSDYPVYQYLFIQLVALTPGHTFHKKIYICVYSRYTRDTLLAWWIHHICSCVGCHILWTLWFEGDIKITVDSSASLFVISWRLFIQKGDRNAVDNNRGVSLSSVLSKVFTKVLNSRLRFWAEAGAVLSEAQSGYRKNYSTIDKVFTLHSLIHRNISKNGNHFYCAFVDFSKAYDTVNRSKLLWL